VLVFLQDNQPKRLPWKTTTKDRHVKNSIACSETMIKKKRRDQDPEGEGLLSELLRIFEISASVRIDTKCECHC
jgi:hypothetical protein